MRGASRRSASVWRRWRPSWVCSATSSSALLIRDVISARPVSVPQLLAEGVQILVVLAVGFALLFWQLDRGGPDGRVQPDVERMAFWFTQDAIREYSDEFDNWRPRFLDHVYLAITNTMAFSPTDTMPPSRTAKMLMVWESLVAFATMAVLRARAVNILT